MGEKKKGGSSDLHHQVSMGHGGGRSCFLGVTPAEAQSLRTPLTTRRLGEGELGEVAACAATD